MEEAIFVHLFELVVLSMSKLSVQWIVTFVFEVFVAQMCVQTICAVSDSESIYFWQWEGTIVMCPQEKPRKQNWISFLLSPYSGSL